MNRKLKHKVAIIGLGYVGLPLYLLCIKKKIDVLGYDVDKKKIDQLRSNVSYNLDIKSSELRKIKKEKIFNMDQIKNISSRNIIIFCLPTPVTKQNNPDMSFIKKALYKISQFITDNTLLVIESTVYPGATREIFEEIFNKKLKKKKININYGFSSERISPGQKDKRKYKIDYQDIPKVISANTQISLQKMNSFYKLLFSKTFMAKSIEVAEMSKLLENSYRSVNIGLVNEFKIICKKNKINIHDVISAASTKSFGFKTFNPGPGVGGHCIPIDPLFVSWYAKKNGLSADFIELARKKNLNITNWVIREIMKVLNNLKLNKPKILIIGVAYKEDVNDYRESPSLRIIEKIKSCNINIDYFDPFIPQVSINKKNIFSIKNLNSISSYDLVILATNHSNLPYNKILDQSKILMDARGQYKGNNSKKIHFI
jgi:UDP-N-acetyl-D-glucosamine dehydrogenase